MENKDRKGPGDRASNPVIRPEPFRESVQEIRRRNKELGELVAALIGEWNRLKRANRPLEDPLVLLIERSAARDFLDYQRRVEEIEDRGGDAATLVCDRELMDMIQEEFPCLEHRSEGLVH